MTVSGRTHSVECCRSNATTFSFRAIRDLRLTNAATTQWRIRISCKFARRQGPLNLQASNWTFGTACISLQIANATRAATAWPFFQGVTANWILGIVSYEEYETHSAGIHHW